MAKKQNKAHGLDRLAAKRLQIFTQAVAYTFGGVALFGVAGYLIDHFVGSFPIAFIVAIVLSFPAVQIALYKRFTKN